MTLCRIIGHKWSATFMIGRHRLHSCERCFVTAAER